MMSSPTFRKRCKSWDTSPIKRSRSNSRVKLDELHRLLDRTILEHQHPVTGLLPAFLYADGTPGWAKNDAWVRDNVYSVLAIWGISIAYQRQADTEDDRLRAHQLEQSVVKLMRGLLFCMMSQVDKVEKFKQNHDQSSALHAKYSLSTCGTVVGDNDWGHLQVDATSLYLLMLAEMTAAGLQIVFTLDEVVFIQNLVFYIEQAYRIPDYGIWERGDKSNHGERELNASSIGMAKAALEAISGLDLFGARGGQDSVIHVMHDLVAQCHTKLNSLLPRESSSKEVDASLLTIIGYPAFAVENPELIRETKDKIISKLMGNYGCRRFLRDGNQTVKEDSSRLHYELAELKVFENIECEWPLFLLLLLLGALIEGDQHEIQEYRSRLNKLVLTSDKTGLQTVPELYYVPEDKVELEYQEPHSQERLHGAKIQHMWSQSLYILCGLLEGRFINIGEIDPLNRRLSQSSRPDTLVQVVLLAEDRKLRNQLSTMGIPSETIRQTEHSHFHPVKILPARGLTKIFEHLGVNKKMGLTGRPPHMLGVIATSQFYKYSLHSRHVFAFTPQFLDHESFYLSFDNELLVDLIHTDLAYLKSNWRLIGRPTMVLPILRNMLGEESKWDSSPILKLLHVLASGYSSGVRVQLGIMKDFYSTASIKNLSFVDPSIAGEIFDIPNVDLIPKHVFLKHQRNSLTKIDPARTPLTRKVLGSVRRTRKTPPLKPRHSIFIPEFGTPKEQRRSIIDTPSDETSAELKFALAWTKKDDNSAGLLNVPSEGGIGGNTLGHSPSTASLRDMANMETHNIDDIIEKLQHESNIFLQADYLNYVYSNYGKEFVMQIRGQDCTVELLLEELYKKAAASGLWSLVRHTAGMLHKRVEDLGPAATDLLVRQKIFSVGQPTSEEHIVQPCTSAELLNHIIEASAGDYSAVALTQEVLVYLAMFIRSEPELFSEMLRLRIGLICNVMVLELSRTMSVSAEDALEKLLELSPFDLKHLLHLIFSSREFTVDEIKSNRHSGIFGGEVTNMPIKQLSILAPSKKRVHGKLQRNVLELGSVDYSAMSPEPKVEEGMGHGHWLRRRRLDGALNRVPPDFYSNVWHILERCSEINFGMVTLHQYPTIQEMTPGELKFATTLETKLNSLPDPEYRQLVVEALMIFSVVTKSSGPPLLQNCSLQVQNIIITAQSYFLDDQKLTGGPAVACCVKEPGSCGGPAGLCTHFYDSAPSGRYGTMSYLAQAMASELRGLDRASNECKIT